MEDIMLMKCSQGKCSHGQEKDFMREGEREESKNEA